MFSPRVRLIPNLIVGVVMQIACKAYMISSVLMSNRFGSINRSLGMYSIIEEFDPFPYLHDTVRH